MCYESKIIVAIKQTAFLYLYRVSNIYQNRETLTEKVFYLETVVSLPRSEMQTHQRYSHLSPLGSLCRDLCSLYAHITVKSFLREV